MIELVFATNNKNKLKEAEAILPESYLLLNLDDAGCNGEVEETEDSLTGNALLKARYVLENSSFSCFADDTGLEINALNGEPGVYSARYAGEQRSDNDNIQLVLDKLSSKNDRSARFKTVIALTIDNQQHLFEGIVNGIIRTEKSGTNGFGYDPIFEPENCGKTFAEMDMDEKNSYSHRGPPRGHRSGPANPHRD